MPGVSIEMASGGALSMGGIGLATGTGGATTLTGGSVSSGGATGDRCDGIFGGAFGRWMLSEMRRGASGFMPAAEVIDVYVQLWNAAEQGDLARARHIFNLILPLINQLMLLGLPVSKEVLVRRGIFQSARMRSPGALALDDDDRLELDAILADLQPYFTA